MGESAEERRSITPPPSTSHLHDLFHDNILTDTELIVKHKDVSVNFHVNYDRMLLEADGGPATCAPLHSRSALACIPADVLERRHARGAYRAGDNQRSLCRSGKMALRKLMRVSIWCEHRCVRLSNGCTSRRHS